MSKIKKTLYCVDKNVGHLELSYKMAATLEKSLGISKNFEHIFTLLPSNPISRYFLKTNEYIPVQNLLCKCS